ncbi:MAG TPA: NACHT domain-containing protein [Streptosporangiaceae bacterium]|nr:NACHT domain-containing protein [Streptosporangiaceae bacterium]
MTTADALHQTIVCVDVERFGASDRRDFHRLDVRAGLYKAVRAALARSGVSWDACEDADRGDGVLLIVAPHVPTSRLVIRFPRALAEELDEHNRTADPQTAFRLRVAVHAGELVHDDKGVVGAAVNFTFRLLDADAARAALRGSPGNLVLITSDRVFEEIVQQHRDGDPAAYRRVRVAEKETTTDAWICRPDAPYPPGPDRGSQFDDRPLRHREFERDYLAHVARTLDTLELFGVARGRVSRGYTYADAYIRLAVARADRQRAAADEELTGAGLDVLTAFEETPRVLLRGGAGAGKTTLMRWLAAVVADDSGEEVTGRGWRGAVPFFLPLRRVAETELFVPEELLRVIWDTMADRAPAGWATALFRNGRALLLVDGIDEVPSARRAEVRDRLKALVSTYPKARCVVTTRPFAVAEDWLEGAGFVQYDLLPMSANSTRDFLSRWHAVAAENEGDEATRRWLRECEERLAGLLSARPELRRLAATPLLCGLLCALHQDRNMHLPQDRKSLYDAALDLLLVRWDEQRELRPGEPSLSKEELLVLLQRFAYSFVEDQRVLLDRREATPRINDGMHGLRSQAVDPGAVLQHILERTGLLREPYRDQIQFVHRTFRDYLAAKEIVEAGDLDLLVEHAHQDDWHDVVVMAVAHARPRERDRILRGLLGGNAAADEDDRVRDRLRLVAATCLGQADVVGDDEVRDLVQRAAARLIPPHTAEAADWLARAGSFVLELLPGPEGLSDAQAAYVVRTAAMIGGEQARETIARFTSVEESVVIDELLRAWRLSENPADYARAVLAEVDFGDRLLDVRSRRRAEQLKYLNRLTNVQFRGDLTPLDSLAAIPNLRRLSLMANEVLRDLSPLTGCRSLRTLALTRCPLVENFAPLAGGSVEELELHQMTRVRFGTLSGVRLRGLRVRDRTLAGGLHPLPADLPLRALAVVNRAEERNLRGIERWPGLERVSVFGVPDADEVAALAALPNLRRLRVREPKSAGDLARLEPLASLRELTLTPGQGPFAADQMRAAVRRVLPDVTVHITSPGTM